MPPEELGACRRRYNQAKDNSDMGTLFSFSNHPLKPLFKQERRREEFEAILEQRRAT